MQIEQTTADFQVALTDFRDFAKSRIRGDQMKLDGQTFVNPGVQMTFEAFQAGRNPAPAVQLFAKIRKDSKYHHQIEWCISNGLGHPFPVRFRAALDHYVLEGGAGGAYRLADVDLFVMHEGQLYLVAEGGKGK